jgi:exosortase
VAWFALFVLGVCLLNIDVLSALVRFSLGNATASHAILIPFVSVALVYGGRHEVFRNVGTAVKGGLSVLALAIALRVAIRLLDPAGAGADHLSLRVGALVLQWLGGFVLLFGWGAVREARFALAFLILTVPIPVALIAAATRFLKWGSSEAVVALFTLTATPFHREGFVFSLPRLTIEIADACSGIRSSLALLITALLAGHLALQTTWRKAVLVLAVLPLVLIKNGIRIVSLSLLASYVNPSFLSGPLHTEGGLVFYLLALGLFAPLLGMLHRSETIRAARREPSSIA